jgi:hypothetical protein
MADVAHREVYVMNAMEARKRLIQTYRETRSSRATARRWHRPFGSSLLPEVCLQATPVEPEQVVFTLAPLDAALTHLPGCLRNRTT